MREFIINLYNGIGTKTLNEKQRRVVKRLSTLGAIKESKELYFINSKYRVGIIDVTRTGFGFLELMHSKSKDLLIEAEDLMGAESGDIVLARQIKSDRRPKAKVVMIIYKKNAIRVVYTQKVNSRIIGVDVKSKQFVTLQESQKSLRKLPPQTVLKLDSLHSKITEVIGVLSDPRVDEKLSLAMYDKSEEFSKSAMREAMSFGDEVDGDMYPDRVDLRDLNFCTIDPIDAKDFDDAIYYDVEKRVLFVAIADVSEYVYEMGNIDKEALKRGFSIYLPHKSIPMLPRNLSENICSLKPNVDRLAFTFKIYFDENFEIIKEELIEGIINSKRRFHYDEIDEYLEGKEPEDNTDREILDFLFPLNDAMNILRKKRLKNSFDLNSDDVRMELDDKQNLISLRVEKETPSHKLIEDCMLLANKASAKMIERGIYRVHAEPKESKVDNLIMDLASIGIENQREHKTIYSLFSELQEIATQRDLRSYADTLIIRTQQRACYSSDNIGHFGLGFSDYSHFTSPIRRYSDLILHRILKSKIQNDKKRIKFLLKNISDECSLISTLERESARVEWDYKDRKFARWAKENIGKVFSATVIDPKRTPIATLEDEMCYGARIFVTAHRDLNLFEKINVEIVDSDIIGKDIAGRLVEL